MKNSKSVQEFFKRSIEVKRRFIIYAMQRDKRLLGNRKEYINYFFNVWLPENDPDLTHSESVFELANYHLFISEKRLYELIKEKNTEPIGT